MTWYDELSRLYSLLMTHPVRKRSLSIWHCCVCQCADHQLPWNVTVAVVPRATKQRLYLGNICCRQLFNSSGMLVPSFSSWCRQNLQGITLNHEMQKWQGLLSQQQAYRHRSAVFGGTSLCSGKHAGAGAGSRKHAGADAGRTTCCMS